MSCGGCVNYGAPIVYWLGFRWIGTPWPKRLYLDGWSIRVRKEPGCGCLYKPRAIITGITVAAGVLWRALRA